MRKATMILEGGSTRGVFTAGVLDCLMEKKFEVSHVIGVSAGACNAADYVSGQIGRTRRCMIPEGEEYKYINGPKKILEEKSLMDMDLIFERFPNDMIPFDYDTYFTSEMHCEFVVTNCLTGEAEYKDDRTDRDRLMKIIRASCSMPLVTPIADIDGVPYLDGGLADSIPIRRAEEYGNEKIIVVLTRNDGYRKKIISPAMEQLYRNLYKEYPNLVRTILIRSMIYNKELNHVERLEQEGKVFVIRPNGKVVGRVEQDPKELVAFFDQGYQVMEERYEALLQYLNM